jgi:glycosyltransferase involved in cell wall biosynthesis
MLFMRVLRIYHGGRSREHRERERALFAAGIDITLVTTSQWPEGDPESTASHEDYPIIELPVRRPGDVNRHAYAESRALASVVHEVGPDVLDVHEEPFSVAARQWLAAAQPDLPVVMYAAQNVDKRLPPPFAQYETAAYGRVAALYPCSRQAAAVARGKGFAGFIEVLPLGYDDAVFRPGDQSLDQDELVVGLFGRLVPEKGVTDAVEILGRVNTARPARLIVVGSGPEAAATRGRAAALGLTNRLELLSWRPASELADVYRRTHVVLVPSRPTTTWVEQFGRVIVEAQASGAVVAGYASGAIPEVAGEPAILTEVGAVAELGARVAALVSDPADYARRRAQGIELSSTRTWEQVAARQVDLYRRADAGDIRRLELPRSPRRRRQLAQTEFGPAASTTAGARPFALPILRRGGMVAAAVAGALDVTAELSARLTSIFR